MCLLKPNGWKKVIIDPRRQPKMLTTVTPSETFVLTFLFFFGYKSVFLLVLVR